jgi:hypothetical protein
MAKVSKAQMGKAVVKKKAVKDSVESEMNPGKMIPKSAVTKGPYITPKKSAPKKKMKDGGSLGMKSVKAGYDSNPGVTRADIIVAAKKKAKSGATLAPSKKSVSSNLGGYKKVLGKNYSKAKSGVKMMMGGGKCKYGC